MADFKIGDEFDVENFATLVIELACKSDLEIQKVGAMRRVAGRDRNRKQIKR